MSFSEPSTWPLPPDGIRFVLPQFLVSALARNPLCAGLYPLSFGYYPRAAGHRVRRDRHDNTLLIYVVDGAGSIAQGGATISAGAGDLLLLREPEPHAYAADGAKPWTIFWTHFAGADLPRLLTRADNTPFEVRTRLGPSPALVNSFETLLDVRRSGFEETAFVYAASVLRQMLCYLRLQRERADAQMLDAVDTFMRERVHARVDLTALAESARLSKFHFAKKYRELTGTSPMRRFTHMKVERACHLLDVTDAPVSAVAAQLGFDDAYYFSRVFRKVVGLSPREYRRLRSQ